MLFTPKHIRQVLNGDKTQTRRQWDKPQVKKGNSYRATTDLFTPRDEAPAYIIVENVYKEKLGDITPEDADAEGNYTVEEFQDEWREINGEWNPDDTIWVVEITGTKEDPRK